MTGLPEYPTIMQVESYQYERYDVGDLRPHHVAVLTYAERPDLAEQDLLKIYLRGMGTSWERYRLIRVSHWDEIKDRWVGHKVAGDWVVNPLILERQVA